jgi:tensin
MLNLSSWYDSIEKKLGSASQLVERNLGNASLLVDQKATALLGLVPPPADASLRDLTYITPHLIASGFPPCSTSNKVKVVDPALVSFLTARHGDRFLVWNLSEISYDGLSAVEFRFPGHPSAPLGALFELCTSLESYLQDGQNVAMVHCATGKGRTLTVLACYLAWIGYENFTPQQALAFVCEKRGLALHQATIPSQRRYVEVR